MKPAVVDVWDNATFGSDLGKELEAHVDLLLKHFDTERRIFPDHDVGRNRSLARPENPYAQAYMDFSEAIAKDMEARTIRAWHYTRLTDAEVDALLREGVHLSTPETLHRRLTAQVEAGAISADAAEHILAKSPFQTTQFDSRVNRFWMTSHPVEVGNVGVQPLLMHWGGEVASMFLRDESILTSIAAVGRSRVVELAVPVKLADAGYKTGRAVIATFARSKGAIPEKFDFDLRVTTALPPAAVLAVHTAGEETFDAIGRSYPAGYVDVSIGRWKELTGED